MAVTYVVMHLGYFCSHTLTKLKTLTYLKTAYKIKTYKHRLKYNFFHQIRNKANNIYDYF